MERPIPTSIKVLCLAFTSVLLCLSVQARADDSATTGVVATVDGEPVYYREILPDDVYGYELLFWVREGHKPTSKKDREKIKKEIETGIMSSLRRNIETKIRDRWIKDQGIEVTESDLDDFWYPYKVVMEKMPKADFMKSYKAGFAKEDHIIEAATAIYEEGKNKDQVFEEYIKTLPYKISRAQWEFQVHSLRKKSKRDALTEMSKELANRSYEEIIEKDKEGYRHLVFDLKLKSKVHEAIAKNDNSVKKWLKNNPLKLKYETLEEHKNELFIFPKDPMADKRYRFWRNMYRKADIKILDPKYAIVLTYIREDVLD